MREEGVPGAAVALVCEDGVVSTGLGVTRQGSQDRVRPTTRFQTGSVTKMFTAAAALALTEEGRVDLTSPVSQWVPYTNTSEPFGQSITLQDLLSHTAGYPTYWRDGRYDPYELPDLFVNNADEPLWAPPGAVWLYSNLGFALAGLVLQEAADQDFREIVRTRILEPAHMDSARMDPNVVAEEGDFAYGHSQDPSYPEPVGPRGAYFAATAYGPMGGLWASVLDLAAWARASLRMDESVLSSSSWRLLRTPVAPTKQGPGESYGLGLFVDEFHSPRVLFHGGSTVGFLAWWYLVPERGIGLVLLTNCDWWGLSPYRILEAALVELAGLEEGDPDEYAPDPARIPGLLGSYDSTELGRFSVEEQAGSLYVHFEARGQRVRLEPVVQDGYYYWSRDWSTYVPLTFWRDDSDVARYAASLEGVGLRVE